MNLHALRLRGLTCFTDEVGVDFDRLDGPLVAVAGPNGAGKTTLLEAVLVAIYGVMPTRPSSIYDYCSGRDAYVELDATLGGHRWIFRRLIDAERRTPTILIWIDGVPQTDGKVGEANALVAAHWPPLTQVLATVFAAQGGAGSFLSLLPSARKDLLVSMLGLDRVQELAAAAALGVTAARGALAVAADRADRARDRALELDAARADLARLAVAAAQVEADAASAQVARDDAQRQADDAQNAEREAVQRRDHLGLEVARVVEVARVADAALALAERQYAAAVAAAAGLAEARAAAGDLPRLREERDAAEADWRSADDALRAATAEADQAGAARLPLIRSLADLDRRIAALPDAAGLAAARADADAERGAIDEIDRLTTAAEAAALDSARLATAAEQERAARLALTTAESRAELVDRVPCGGRSWQLASGWTLDCDGCALLVDAIDARGRIPDLWSDLDFVDGASVDANAAAQSARAAATARDEARRRGAALRGAGARLASAESEAARREGLSTARHEGRAQLDAAESLYGERARAVAPLLPISEAARARLDQARTAVQRAETARDHVADLATRAAELDGLALRRTEAEAAARDAARLTTTTRTARDAAEAAVAVPHSIRLGADDVLVAAQAEERRTRQLAEEARRAADKAAGRLDALGEMEDAAEEARAALVAAERDAEDAGILAGALGRDGIQAMELDAAVPAVSSLATEILRVVYGSRFACILTTQALRKGAAGRRGETREVFDVRVVDAERGTAGPAERLSGGEQVVISEAIRLAFAVFAAQSSAVPIRTLIRDESDGALDAERAVYYPAMLRRAAALGGFTRVLLVSHRPDTVAACDGVIRVQDGLVRIETC